MKILALDTSTEACSAAINIDGQITAVCQLAPREHSRLILGMTRDLLSEAHCTLAEIDAIAFGRGPGSFMGLRIAAGVTQGMAMVNNTPVIPVSTLMAIAEVAYRQTGDEQVLTAIDARMEEVYWAAYRKLDNGWQLQVDECVCPPGAVAYPETGQWLAAGTGWRSYRDQLLDDSSIQPHGFITECYPTAEAIASIAATAFENGETRSAISAVPVYLRNNVAKKPKPVIFPG